MSVRKAIWKNADQFSRQEGTVPPEFDNVEIVGVDDSAYLVLKSKDRPTENISFTTPGNYAYDPTKVEINGGKGKLKAFVAGEINWPFTTPANYSCDPAKIEVTSGQAKLKGTPYIPYAQWHMNESSGVNVPDSSGNGRDGACINMEDADWVPGKLNNCLRFNEGGTTNEYVNCGSIASFERTDSFSIEFWVKILGSSGSGVIRLVYKYGSPTGYLVYSHGGQINLYLSHASGNRIRVKAGSGIEDGNWHHVIVTYDGSSLASGVDIYIDGALQTPAIDEDTLTGSIITGSTLRLCYGAVTYSLNGYLDETVIYEKKLIQAEVDVRYNSGAGSENFLGSYAEDNPPIVPNAGFAFNNPLGAFTETATKPGSDIKYHVSSDDGVVWKYWNGSAWVATNGTYAQANTAAEVNDEINSLAGSGTLKSRALLHSDTGAETPELDNIYIAEGVSYTTTPQEIAMDWDIQPAHTYQWLEVLETVAKPTGTEIAYQYSIDGGANWNGSWLGATQLGLVLFGLVLVGDGTDKLKIKFLLSTTNSSKTPEIDNLAIKYETGYEATGSYASTKYYPATWYIGGIAVEGIAFDIETPSGTAIKVRARAVDEALETNYNKPWTEYNSGDLIGICGQLIQWEVEMTTTNPANTPKLNWVEVEFHILIGTLRMLPGDVWNELLNEHTTPDTTGEAINKLNAPDVRGTPFDPDGSLP